MVREGSVDVEICASQQLDRFIEKDVGSVRLRIWVSKSYCSDRGEALYRWAANRGARLSLSVLAPKVLEGREYALMLLEDCRAFLMRGFERSVVTPIPRKPRVTLYAHSHPRAPSIPSHRDLLSAINMLSDGVYETCIVGVDGATCLYRVSYLTLEDFEKLVDLANNMKCAEDLFAWVSRCESVKVLTL
ncbi:MAG: hypothetical protein GXO32_01205 [Crenarchaeota archaeon]|nr:hypothetical protein [Thermoproteota archaeon]